MPTRSRCHKACEHVVAKGRNKEILEQIETGGVQRWDVLSFFRDGLLDGTRGENWGRAVEGHMLDGCATRGDIEVGGL